MKDGISVLMAVYSGDDAFLFDRALRSIWHNQHLKPDEIILVQDGDVPKEISDVIQKFKKALKEQLQHLLLKQNRGLAIALNEGLKVCNFSYVARMDSDDVSLPDRFAMQKTFLDNNHSITIVGGNVEEVDEQDSEKNSFRLLPQRSDQTRRMAGFRSPLNHPTVMMRTSVIQKLGGYPKFRKCQDYALWGKVLSNGYEIANIDRVLVKMDAGRELFSRRGIAHWQHEKQVFKYFLSIGFMTRTQCYWNIMLRFVLRLPPLMIRRWIYKILRSVDLS